ncbi:MAG: CHAT domain-containing protein, partial [Ardenticatenaceae bacterium]
NKQGQYELALEQYNQALEIFREVGDRAGEGKGLDNIGFVYEQQGQAEEALLYYEQAMDIQEAVRATAGSDKERASFIAQHAGLYDRAIGLYRQQGQDKEAFLTSERGRARSFLDSLATGSVQLSDGDLQELLTREREAYDERFAIRDELARVRAQNPPDTEAVANLEARLEAVEGEHAAAMTAIEARGDELLALVPGRSSVPTLDEVQALLDEQTTLVSYWVLGEEGTLAFVMTRESLVVVELPDATPKNLFTKLDELSLWPSTTEPHPESLQTLHAWLVEPLAEHLNTPKVGIIPHQLLHYVPFAALTDGESYFGSQKVLFWLPSASALRFVQDKAKEATETDSQGALVFGNPTTNEKGLGSLPGAADEAQKVADLFTTAHYIKGQATETQLRESVAGQKVVHLAAHGVYSSTAPLNNTFIALAPDDEHDGRLETGEVYGLELAGSQLVTLSACQTQIGELNDAEQVVSAGDEIVGLTRAFFFAGTPTVLSSLWNVDDAATAKLMTAFYRHWQSGMGKAEALQAAQAEIRQTYPSPYHWAGFVLSGDAGEVTKSGTSLAQKVALAIAGLLGVGLLLLLGVALRKRSRV